jgi:hypothetical protein
MVHLWYKQGILYKEACGALAALVSRREGAPVGAAPEHIASDIADDGSGKGTKVRACVKAGMTKCALANCITCKMVPRKQHSDKCNSCQLAVFFSTYQ